MYTLNRFRFFLLLVGGFHLSIQAQTVIEGYVSDFSGKQFIGGAGVVSSTKAGKDTGYKITDKDGYYKLSFVSDEDSLFLTVSCLAYETKKIQIPNRSQKVDFRLSSKEIELKEVVVESPSVWQFGDTISFRVDAFSSPQDRVIGDVLKKLPGFEVGPAGDIKFNGQVINQFTIEDLDLLGARYGIATNNVPVGAVQNVEVVENNQPVKALKGIVDSQQPSVNLKLKKDKLIRPFGTVSAGVGGFNDFLWDLDVFSFYTGIGQQAILLYKTNNAGNNIDAELTEFSLGPGSPRIPNHSLSGPLKGDNAGHPSLKSNRYLFNNSHILTLNYLQKATGNSTLKTNINYRRNKIDERVEQNSSYVIGDKNLVINEIKISEQKRDELDCSLHYHDNSSGYFINDVLTGKINRIGSDVNIASARSVFERYDIPEYYVGNNAHLVKRIKNKAFTFDSYVSYSSVPQKLTINVDTTDFVTEQSVFRSGFYTTNSTAFAYTRGYSNLNLGVNVEASFEDLNSDLNTRLYADTTTRDNLSFDYTKTTLTPSYQYNKGDLSVSLRSPLVHQGFFIRNRIYENDDRQFILYLNPTLSLRYTFNPFFTGGFTTQHSTTQGGDILDFTHGYIMQNYRNTKGAASGILRKSEAQNYSVNFAYKNLLKFVTLNTTMSYSSGKSNTINSLKFDGNHSVSANTGRESRHDTQSYGIRGGKYVSGIKSNFSLSVNYSQTSLERLQQSILFPSVNKTWTVIPKMDVKINKNASLEYQLNYTNNGSQIKSAERTDKTEINQLSQNLSCFYHFLDNRLSVNTKLEYLRNDITPDISKGMFFADTGMNYNTKTLDFSLEWSNIFNRTEYAYTSSNSLDTYTYRYRLRPANVLAKVTFKY